MDKRPLEMCIVCDGETGNSGYGEDSLYGILNYSIKYGPLQNEHFKAGMNLGPLCGYCHHCLSQVGFIENL